MPKPGSEYREGLSTSIFAGREDKGEIRNALQRDRQHLKELGERLGCGGGNKYSTEREEMFAKPRRTRTAKDIKDPNSKQATNPANAFDATGGQFCQLCGAWRGELGSEPTIELFIAHLVAVFREVWRVLRSDGTAWVNMGSSYMAGAASDDMMQFRDDLKPEELAYVLAELAKCKSL